MDHAYTPLCRIEVTADYSPLAFIYSLFQPTITINGYPQQYPWGTRYFDVPPGDYEVAVSYPWLFMRECGRNSVRFRIGPSELRRVRYTAGLIRFVPGKITVT